MKVLVAEAVTPAALDVLNAQKGWEVVVATPENYGPHLADCDALVVRSQRVDRSVIARAPKLRVIGRAGVGAENIDLPAATSAGVLVMHTPGINAVSVAEHTMALMLSLARMIPAATASTTSGKWERRSFVGHELRGKTLGILGMGSIGREVIVRAKSFAMHVIAHDPFVNPQAAVDLDVELVSLEQLYAASDYISLHVALTPATRKIINAGSIEKMRDGVRIINCAQGGLVDNDALLDALRSGKVGGAGLDVFDPEPLPSDHPLLKAPNLIATPHIGGVTEEAKDIVGVRIMEQVVQYLTNGVAVNAVNMPTISPEQYRALGPYIALGERLGTFAISISSGNPKSARFSYTGRVAELTTQLVRNAGLAGLLNGSLTHKANLVNAMQLASQRGLRVAEVHEKHSASYTDTVRVELETSEGTVSVEGALVLGNMRLLRVNGIYCEAKLDGHITYIVNEDVPGTIGAIGRVLGAASINVANFSLGREDEPAKPGEPLMAVAVIETDCTVPEAVLTQLLEIRAIKQARVIELHT
ncbi:MAG: phosphoglycerate dehydrogenase [Acidobacteria bacterium]|nr:phosphoglycerate dehydrogenase [Acidobacteriota bacterium]